MSCDEVLCRSESAVTAIADMLEALYWAQGDDIVVCTGYYDLAEDERCHEEDE